MISVTNDTKTFFEDESAPIYIYGAGYYGKWIAWFMQKCSMDFEGFIDKAIDRDGVFVLGKKIVHPKILQTLPKMRLRIIIATSQADEVMTELPGYAENIDVRCMVPVYESLTSDEKVYDINKFLSYFRAKLIRVEIPTIISDRCTAGLIYRALGKGMLSPTINTGISAEDFIKICKNPKDYLSEEMVFGCWTKIPGGKIVPVGRIKDVEVAFGYENDEIKAIQRWNRMRKWINWNDIIYIMSNNREKSIIPYHLPYQLVEEFCSLKEKHLLLTGGGNPLYLGKNLSGYVRVNHLHFHDIDRVIESWFDLLGWINGEYVI